MTYVSIHNIDRVQLKRLIEDDLDMLVLTTTDTSGRDVEINLFFKADVQTILEELENETLQALETLDR